MKHFCFGLEDGFQAKNGRQNRLCFVLMHLQIGIPKESYVVEGHDNAAMKEGWKGASYTISYSLFQATYDIPGSAEDLEILIVENCGE
jgi:hypothetical protein